MSSVKKSLKMSLSPSKIFHRLQELKLWQRNHEKLFKRSSENVEVLPEEASSLSDYQSIEGLSNFDSSSNVSPQKNSPLKRDPQFGSVEITPQKSFDEMLEEQLGEYEPQEVNVDRPKKPFLRKGTGLARFRLQPGEIEKYAHKGVRKPIITQRPPIFEPLKRKSQPPKTGGAPKRKITPKPLPVKKRTDFLPAEYLSPLKVPEIAIKAKGKWCEVKENPKITHVAPLKTNKNESGDCPEYVAPPYETNLDLSPLNSELNMLSNNSSFERDFEEFVNKFNKNGRGRNGGTNFEVICEAAQKESIKIQNDIRDLLGKNRNLSTIMEPKETKSKDISTNTLQSLHPSNESIIEKALETELRIFEALERKAEDDSFCSTNSSVMRIFQTTSTPTGQKTNENTSQNTEKHKIIQINREFKSPPSRQAVTASHFETSEHRCVIEEESDLTAFESALDVIKPPKCQNDTEFCQKNIKFCENDTKFYQNDVKYCQNDAKFCQNDAKFCQNDAKYCQNDAKYCQNDVIFHKNDNVGQLTENSDSFESDSTENDSISSNDETTTNFSIKTNENGNFSDVSNDKTHHQVKNKQNMQNCNICDDIIKNKISECDVELQNLKMEKNKIVALKEQMAKDQIEFQKDMKLRRKQFEEQRLKIQLELEEEKKKVAKEKVLVQLYSKEAHKRPTKAEREEITNLKYEITELKELMKLRETKNSTCIARLRNQVKQLEKDNTNLKKDVEKLSKEKAKLHAQQMNYRKPTDTKMLHEINKNLTKLTQETFKNHHFKPETSSEDISNSPSTIKQKTPILQNSGPLKPQTVSQTQPQMSKSISQTRKPILVQPKPEISNNVQNIDHESVDIINTSEEFATSSFLNVEREYESVFSNITKDSNSSNASDGRKLERSETVMEDGTKEIKYSNGNIKTILTDGTVRYYYAGRDTWHTNFNDGTEVIEFPNGQSEKRFKDGKCVVFFTDGLVQTIFPDGNEEIKYPDGSKLVTKVNGEKILFLSNGQKEIHTKDQKRREYPDGTVKILYPDGSQETRYANGRVRLRDASGSLVMDSIPQLQNNQTPALNS